MINLAEISQEKFRDDQIWRSHIEVREACQNIQKVESVISRCASSAIQKVYTSLHHKSFASLGCLSSSRVLSVESKETFKIRSKEVEK